MTRKMPPRRPKGVRTTRRIRTLRLCLLSTSLAMASSCQPDARLTRMIVEPVMNDVYGPLVRTFFV